MLYKAFISYSHAADGKLAPAVQKALQEIAKPWYRRRSMRVFRDETNLQTSPGLWSSIESALSEAEFFLFMASPRAAQSHWVQKEVEWWLTHRSWQTFLILLTDGDIEWDPSRQTLDWSRTNALPPQVGPACVEEPLYTDLRWAKTTDQLSARHSQFRPAILNVAAALLHRAKDDLDSDDIRQYRRTRRIAWTAASVLAVLLVVAVISAYYANQQAKLATSRALGARAEAVLPTNPELALLLAREAVRFNPDEQAELALRQAFAGSPVLTIHHAPPGRNLVAVFAGTDALVAAEPGKRAAVWNVATGQRVTDLTPEVGDRLRLSRSPAGSLVVLGTEQSGFELYDSKTWKAVARLPGSGARFSGSILVANQDDKFRQWSIPSLQEIPVTASVPEEFRVRDVSPDGSLLFLAKGDEVSAGMVVEAATSQVLATFPESVLREGAVFSPNSTMLVTEGLGKSGGDSGFQLWDPRTGDKIRGLEQPDDMGWTTYVAFSPDGKKLVAGNRNGALHAWDLETGKLLGIQHNHRNDVGKIEFSPDGKAMLSVAADGTACLWDTASMRCQVTLGGRGDSAWDVGFAPDSKRFLTTHLDGTVRVWNRDVWFPTSTFPAENAIVSSDQRTLVGASRNGPIRVWDTESGELKTTLENSPDEIESLAMSVPTSLIGVAPAKGAVQLWTITGKKTVRLGSSSEKTTALAFNTSGTELVTGGETGAIRFWNPRDGTLLRTWQANKEKITSLVVHPDGQRIVIGSWDGKAQVRDIKTSKVLLETKLEEDDAVTLGLALSSNGKLLIMAGDKFGELWDIDARSKVRNLIGHTDEVYGGAFSPGNRLVLTGSGYMHARGEPPEDGNAVRVWDLRSGRQLSMYRSAELPVRTLSFGRDEKVIIAGSMDGTVRKYECELCLPLPALLDAVSKRATRPLSAGERAQYIPQSGLLN